MQPGRFPRQKAKPLYDTGWYVRKRSIPLEDGPEVFRVNGARVKIVLLCLLIMLLSGCLTPKSAKRGPAIRGLSPSQAEHLEAMNNPRPMPEQMRSDKEESPENLADTAEMFFQTGDYERSLYNYSKLLFQNPERHDIRYKLGLALLLTGKPEEAKKELAEVLLHVPEMPEAHETLGVIYLKENKLAEAQQEFKTTLGLEPKRYQSRCLLGETYLRGNQFSQAISDFKAALELAPRSDRVMSNLGWTYYKMKQYDQSLEWLKKARALNPDNPKLNLRLGMVLAAQKKYPEALAAFRKGGDEAQALNNIGVHYYLEQRYAEAARCFQKALEVRPSFYQEAKVNLEKALAKIQEERPSQEEPRATDLLSLHQNSPPTDGRTKD